AGQGGGVENDRVVAEEIAVPVFIRDAGAGDGPVAADGDVGKEEGAVGLSEVKATAAGVGMVVGERRRRDRQRAGHGAEQAAADFRRAVADDLAVRDGHVPGGVRADPAAAAAVPVGVRGRVVGDEAVADLEGGGAAGDENAPALVAGVVADSGAVQLDAAVHREDAAAVFGGRVVLDDVVIQPQGGAAKHENAAAAALDRHADDPHAERVHRRAVDLEHVVVRGQTTAVDHHGAAALVGDGDAVGEDGQGVRGVVVA